MSLACLLKPFCGSHGAPRPSKITPTSGRRINVSFSIPFGIALETNWNTMLEFGHLPESSMKSPKLMCTVPAWLMLLILVHVHGNRQPVFTRCGHCVHPTWVVLPRGKPFNQRKGTLPNIACIYQTGKLFTQRESALLTMASFHPIGNFLTNVGLVDRTTYK